MSEPITNTADAVRELGALPVPVGSPADRQLDLLRTVVAQSDVATAVTATVADASGLVAGLRARIAELEAERHSTNEALDEAVQALRAKEQSGDSYPPALPWALLMDGEDLADFLDELAAAAITHASGSVALAEVEKTCATWRLIAEAQHGHNTALGPDAVTQVFASVASLREVPDGEHYAVVHHPYRVGHDLPETGGAL